MGQYSQHDKFVDDDAAIKASAEKIYLPTAYTEAGYGNEIILKCWLFFNLRYFAFYVLYADRFHSAKWGEKRHTNNVCSLRVCTSYAEVNENNSILPIHIYCQYIEVHGSIQVASLILLQAPSPFPSPDCWFSPPVVCVASCAAFLHPSISS